LIVFRSRAAYVPVISLMMIACSSTSGDQVELRKIDTSRWPHSNDREGSDTSASGKRRNLQKNRAFTNAKPVANWTVSEFVTKVQAYDQALMLAGRTRRDIERNAAAVKALKRCEDKIVSVMGYLVLAYAAGKEDTNYGSAEFHDWHLEIFERPNDRVPTVGDPTPIICEVTRFTERQLFDKGIRLQPLISEWRAKSNGRIGYHRSGHVAHKVRITGYLFWDDEHNEAGKDVGPRVADIETSAMAFHHPWRLTAWEIHPVTNIEDLGL
jgi:hypothetical protein